MVAVGLLCFGGFAVLFAFTGGRSAGDGGAHAASRSALGFAGVVELLQKTGAPVVLSRDPGGVERLRQGLLILTPNGGSRGPKTMPDGEEQSILLVLPKWEVRTDPDHAGWVEEAGMLPLSQVLGVLPAEWGKVELKRDFGHPQLTDGETGPPLDQIRGLQTLAGKGWEPLVLTRGGGAIMARHRADGVVVLADPDVLNNQAMAKQDRAAAAAALLTALADGDPITFDLSLNGLGRSRNLLRLMFEPPLLGATVCAVAASLLAGLLASQRFGPPALAARALQPGKSQLAMNAASLIARAAREPRMAIPYASLTRRLVAQSLRLPRRLQSAELDAVLNRATASRNGTTWSSLLQESERVRDRGALMRVVSRLYEWRTGFK